MEISGHDQKTLILSATLKYSTSSANTIKLYETISSTNKALIDGVEEGKMPAAQQFGFDTSSTKVP